MGLNYLQWRKLKGGGLKVYASILKCMMKNYWHQYLESQKFVNGITTEFKVYVVLKAKDFLFSVLVEEVGWTGLQDLGQEV